MVVVGVVPHQNRNDSVLVAGGRDDDGGSEKTFHLLASCWLLAVMDGERGEASRITGA